MNTKVCDLVAAIMLEAAYQMVCTQANEWPSRAEFVRRGARLVENMRAAGELPAAE